MDELKRHLKRGKVYRRADLAPWSKSVDRHLKGLVKEGILQKVYTGIYYYPKKSVFGNVPPNESDLIRAFLKGDHFLILSPNFYNNLGIGTTQLYNKKVIYNHKRQGNFRLGNRDYEFQLKNDFLSKVTNEFLMVDLVNNIDRLAEDRDQILNNVLTKATRTPTKKIRHAVSKYGNSKTRKFFHSLLI